MLGDVRLAEGLDGLRRYARQHGGDAGRGIAADVLVAHEIGGGGHEQGDRVRPFHDERVVDHARRAAFRHGFEARLEAKLTLDSQVVGGLAAHHEAIRRSPVHAEVVGRVVRVGLVARTAELGAEGDLPGPVGGQANHDHLVDRRDEHLPGEGDSRLLVARGGKGGVEVELVAVAGRGSALPEAEHERAERLVLLLLHGVAEEAPAEKLVGADELPVEDEPSNLGQYLDTRP